MASGLWPSFRVWGGHLGFTIVKIGKFENPKKWYVYMGLKVKGLGFPKIGGTLFWGSL